MPVLSSTFILGVNFTSYNQDFWSISVIILIYFKPLL